MKTPENTMELVPGIIIVTLLGAFLVYYLVDAGQWLDNNIKAMEAMQVATRMAEALSYTPTPTSIPLPTPETTPTPTNPELQATITALVNQITP